MKAPATTCLFSETYLHIHAATPACLPACHLCGLLRSSIPVPSCLPKTSYHSNWTWASLPPYYYLQAIASWALQRGGGWITCRQEEHLNHWAVVLAPADMVERNILTPCCLWKDEGAQEGRQCSWA